MIKNKIKKLNLSATLEINEISKKLEKEGKNVIKFGFGQSPFQVPKVVVEELRKIYPLNSSISFYLGETLIQNNLNLDYASEILESIEKSHKYNPNYLRLMSKMYNLQKDVFRSKIYLSDYHLLLDNLKLAVQVLNDGIQSRGLTGSQISVLKKKKNQIICKYQRPLEPIFGEKTCD